MFFKEFNHFFKDEVKQEAFDAVTGKEIPIDHAYTMDEMKDITYSNDDLDDDGNPVEEYEEDLCISYAMGVDESILDLQIDGFDMQEDDGNYFVTFDWSNREIWEKYITEHMKDTYWNEYIHLSDLETVFIIKDNGEIARVVNHEFSDDPELLETCNRLCEGDFSSIKELIFSNDYYREYLDEIVQESKMPAKKRNKLKNKDFGLVYKDKKGKTIRKYPLNDKAHVASAARLFGHCPDKYKKRLARKILRKAHEFGMDTSGWDTVNKAAKD